MSETGEPDAHEPPAGSVGLADFLTDLRAELAVAQQRAEGSSLKLGVEEVSVALEVAVTTERRGGGSGKVSAKFWVLNAEVSGSGELSSQRVRTQTLTLTLRPRIEQVTYDAKGQVRQVTTRSVDVAGAVVAGEEAPVLRPATGQRDSEPQGAGG
ncbi:trypco2 family protein [Geodermatophilus sp. SYSU D00710]